METPARAVTLLILAAGLLYVARSAVVGLGRAKRSGPLFGLARRLDLYRFVGLLRFLGWKGRVNYRDYLHSRTWQRKRKQVRTRSKGRCERCRKRPARECHHKTYERLGYERLKDLLDVCAPCHRELHGKA